MIPLLSQIDSSSILILGALLLACGSGSLLIVRLSNPRLRGLGWLGGSFLVGGVGAFLIASPIPSIPYGSAFLSDQLILLALVMLHVGILAMRQEPNGLPRAGAVVLGINAISSLCLHYLHVGGRLRVVVLCLCIAAQLVMTMWMLLRGMKRGVRAPSWFMAILLAMLIAINLFRSAVLFWMGRKLGRDAGAALDAFTYATFIATAMGLAFGFFWMTSAELTTELEHMANTDPLTRIYNRRIFRRWCERELTADHATGSPFSMLMIDLDHFKQINDLYGHQFGDVVLCAAVERMQDAVRGIDVLGRWGGEEFMVMLPGATSESAMIVAERVRANIERLRVPKGAGVQRQAGDTIGVTVSVGVTTYLGAEDHLEAIFHRTDVALYRAKASGRNCVVAQWADTADDSVGGQGDNSRITVLRRSTVPSA